MDRKSVFQRICTSAPFATMTHLLMEANIRSTFGTIFEEFRGRQYEDKLTFEALSVAVADVALGVARSPNAAYRKHKEELGVARSRFYEKLNCVSSTLSEQVVCGSADKLREVQDALGFEKWEGLEGYRLLAVDGNHLQKTQKRMKELRNSNYAPLPGTVVVRLDLDRQLVDRAYLLPDAHQQESDTCDALLADLEPNDVLVADRHYCLVDFMEGIAAKSSFFIIRHHGRLPGVLLENRKRVGRSETGMVYEQKMRLTKSKDSLVVRRITVELDQPTQDGDTVIHILTNLPSEVETRAIAVAYHRRWEEEDAFYYVKMCFHGELKTLGHPQAALYLFSLSLIAFNILQVIHAACYAVHDDEAVANLSNIYISHEIADATTGIMIVFEPSDWQEIIPKTLNGQAQLLKRIAKQIKLEDYRKSVRKKNPHKRKTKRGNVKSKHVSTARIIGLVDH